MFVYIIQMESNHVTSFLALFTFCLYLGEKSSENLLVPFFVPLHSVVNDQMAG